MVLVDADIIEELTKFVLERLGFPYCIDPREQGQDAYEITCEQRDEIRIVLTQYERLRHNAGSALPCAFRFERNQDIRVEWRGGDSWAITDGVNCLSRFGQWEQEPLPSERTDEYLVRCRFTFPEAVVAASLEIDGKFETATARA